MDKCEKVLLGIDCHVNRGNTDCENCPYFHEDFCVWQILLDAQDLLCDKVKNILERGD